MSKEKVILAYSGGLDTSVAITWLMKDYDVVAVCMDVGEGKDLDFIHDKALKVGAVESYVLDVKDEFAEEYVLPALQAHAYYEQKYPLVSALSRPVISKKLVEIAHKTGATTIAHGCTGKGNDQVRFEVAIAALDPELKVMLQFVNGNGLVKKKLNTLKQMVFQFLRTLTIHIQLTKTFGDVLTGVVFLKIHGTKLQKMPLVSQLLQKKL